MDRQAIDLPHRLDDGRRQRHIFHGMADRVFDVHRRGRNIQQQGPRHHAAAALEDIDAQFFLHQRQADAQRRRRRLRRARGAGEDECQRLAFLRGELQPPRLRVIHRSRPEQERARAVRAQHLLGRPPAVFLLRRIDDYHPARVDAVPRKRRRIRDVRRRDQGDPLAGAHQRFERGQDEPQFADALVVEQQLGQRRLRPAAAGQLAIQRGEAAGHSVFRPRQPIPLPKQGVMEQFGERGFHSLGCRTEPTQGESPGGRRSDRRI